MNQFIKLLLFVMLFCMACPDIHAAAKAGEATVTVGSTTTISLATTYQTTLRKATSVSASWSTSNSNVSITSRTNTSCTIKGVTAGTAQVNYYCSYYIDGYYRTMDFYYTVTISGSSSGSSITLTPSSISLYEGETYQVTAYQPGYVGGVYFTTSNSSVASVSTSSNSGYYTYGTVTANSVGTTYIYAKSAAGATSSACTVTVKTKTISPTSILVLPGSKSIEEGEYASLTATVSPSNATYSLTWSSNNTSVATVSSSGRVYGKSPGTARITAKIDGYSLSDYCDITVTAKQIVATSLSAEGPGTLNIGDTYQLSPVYAPNNATVSFQYTSDNSDVVGVSSSGLLTAVGAGSATITVRETISELTKTINVEVAEPEIPDTDISTLDNVIYIGNVEGCIGGQITLFVNLKNAVTAEGFGFDLFLPDGITVAKDEDNFPMVELSTVRTTSKKTNSFDATFQTDGSLRVLAASTNGSAISGNDGEVCRITVDIANDMEEGSYPVLLKNVAVSDIEARSHRTELVKSTIQISTYMTGDANCDGIIDVSDFTAIAHYLLNRTPSSFNAKAADANVDGTIDVADLTAVAHLLLYGTVTRPAQSRVMPYLNPQ